jgi:hypothetical protein
LHIIGRKAQYDLVKCLRFMSAKAKTPRISLISRIWKILIREISEIRGVFAFVDMRRRQLDALHRFPRIHCLTQSK